LFLTVTAQGELVRSGGCGVVTYTWVGILDPSAGPADLGPATPGKGDWSATSAAAAAAAAAACAVGAVGAVVGAVGPAAGKGVLARRLEAAVAAAAHMHWGRRQLLTMRGKDTSERPPADSQRSRTQASATVIGMIEGR
jgi:hypothetical protein